MTFNKTKSDVNSVILDVINNNKNMNVKYLLNQNSFSHHKLIPFVLFCFPVTHANVFICPLIHVVDCASYLWSDMCVNGFFSFFYGHLLKIVYL